MMRLSRMPAATRAACLPCAASRFHMSHNSDVIPRVARSVENVPHSRIRELAEIAMSMDGVYRLYFGESNLPTPDYIKQAADARHARRATPITPKTPGLPSLRRAIAAHYARLHAVELDPAERNRGHRLRRAGAQRGHPRACSTPATKRSCSRPPGPTAPPTWRCANAVPVAVPHPLCGGRYAVDFDALEARRHAAHAAADLHLALESARLGGHRGRAAARCWSSPAATTCGCWPTKSTTASTTPARAWASRCLPSCAWPRATTP